MECFICGVVIGDWVIGDIALVQHKYWSPGCRFMCGEPCDNIPIENLADSDDNSGGEDPFRCNTEVRTRVQDTQRAIRRLQSYTASASSMRTSENWLSSRMHRNCRRGLASTSNDVDVKPTFLNVQRELIHQLWRDRMNRQQTLTAPSDSPMSPPVTPRSPSPIVSPLSSSPASPPQMASTSVQTSNVEWPFNREDEFPVSIAEVSERRADLFQANVRAHRCGQCEDHWLCTKCDNKKMIRGINPGAKLRRFCGRCRCLWLCTNCAVRDDMSEVGRICVLCYDAPINVVLIPCGHFCICKNCYNSMEGGCCPFWELTLMVIQNVYQCDKIKDM